MFKKKQLIRIFQFLIYIFKTYYCIYIYYLVRFPTVIDRRIQFPAQVTLSSHLAIDERSIWIKYVSMFQCGSLFLGSCIFKLISEAT